MARYPGLPFDTESVVADRCRAQRPVGTEDAYSSFFWRPITIYISRWIVRNTTITANSITAAMLVLSIVLPLIAWAVDSRQVFFLVCAGSSLLLLGLDVVDGEVARLRSEQSDIGKFMDMGMWFTLSALSVIVLLRANEWYLDNGYLPVIIIMGAMLKLFSVIVRNQVGPAPAGNGGSDSSATVRLLVQGLAERPSMYLYFVVVSFALSDDGNAAKSAIWLLTILVLALDAFVTIRKGRGSWAVLTR